MFEQCMTTGGVIGGKECGIIFLINLPWFVLAVVENAASSTLRVMPWKYRLHRSLMIYSMKILVFLSENDSKIDYLHGFAYFWPWAYALVLFMAHPLIKQ